MQHAYGLLLMGDANRDIVVGPLDAPHAFGRRERRVDAGARTLGGSASIMACGAARLGLKVAFAGRVGDDDAGRSVRGALEDRGVDTSALRVIAARLRGLSTEHALEIAAACGALSTRAHGATPAQPTWDEAAAAVTRNGKNL
ncbi:PfkB family carbohydrate kinase [Streptomyces sp. NPDC056160]|uniref:carbohydrate kinase family protein n=1 Tax=Streptomyces sp. NPDC056160 TaxID=3345731 RepID=UPI0035DFF734